MSVPPGLQLEARIAPEALTRVVDRLDPIDPVAAIGVVDAGDGVPDALLQDESVRLDQPAHDATVAAVVDADSPIRPDRIGQAGQGDRRRNRTAPSGRVEMEPA